MANVDRLRRYVGGDSSGEAGTLTGAQTGTLTGAQTGTLTGAQTGTLTGAQDNTRTGILDTEQNELNSFQADVMEPRPRPRRKSRHPRRFVDGSFLRPVDRSPFSHELSATVGHCRFVRMVFHCPSCPKEFESSSGRRRHLLRHHKLKYDRLGKRDPSTNKRWRTRYWNYRCSSVTNANGPLRDNVRNRHSFVLPPQSCPTWRGKSRAEVLFLLKGRLSQTRLSTS